MSDAIAVPEDEAVPENGAATSRRALLGKTAVAAAVATVAGLGVAKRADAANGSNFLIGSSANSATADTALSGGSSLIVTNGTSESVGGGASSIVGYHASTNGVGVGGVADGDGGKGVYGRFEGTGAPGSGVQGDNFMTSGIGVYGRNFGGDGAGVYGEHDNTSSAGTGVSGTSNYGAGVYAAGTSYDLVVGGVGTLWLSTGTLANPPTSGTIGTIGRDSSGNLWVCVTTGSPGTWRRIAGPSTAGSLNLLATPKRVYDSRAGEPPLIGVKAPLTGATRTIDCKLNSSGVPTGATGLVLNITVIALSPQGYVGVAPGGAGFTGTSLLNWTAAGAVVANGVTVGCPAAATVDVTAGGGGSVEFIVDVFGYYR